MFEENTQMNQQREQPEYSNMAKDIASMMIDRFNAKEQRALIDKIEEIVLEAHSTCVESADLAFKKASEAKNIFLGNHPSHPAKA